MPGALPVSGAEFFDVVGTPRRSGVVWFVPALLDLVGPVVTEPWPAERLAERLGACGDEGHELRRQLVEDPVSEVFHPHWVRSRVAAVFGWAPPSVGAERPSLLDVGFVAVAETAGELRADPFVLSDLEYDVRLLFGAATGQERRRGIASAFWEVLLADPLGLVPFHSEYTAFHELDTSCQVAGLDHGGFYDEPLWREEDEMEFEYDPHGLALTGARCACPECGGSGEESFCPANSPCEVCGGSGEGGWAAPLDAR